MRPTNDEIEKWTRDYCDNMGDDPIEVSDLRQACEECAKWARDQRQKQTEGPFRINEYEDAYGQCFEIVADIPKWGECYIGSVEESRYQFPDHGQARVNAQVMVEALNKMWTASNSPKPTTRNE